MEQDWWVDASALVHLSLIHPWIYDAQRKYKLSELLLTSSDAGKGYAESRVSDDLSSSPGNIVFTVCLGQIYPDFTLVETRPCKPLLQVLCKYSCQQFADLLNLGGVKFARCSQWPAGLVDREEEDSFKVLKWISHMRKTHLPEMELLYQLHQDTGPKKWFHNFGAGANKSKNLVFWIHFLTRMWLGFADCARIKTSVFTFQGWDIRDKFSINFTWQNQQI